MTVQRLDFEIDGLNCGACVARAEKAIASVAGVEKAEVNLGTKSARVLIDGADTKAISGALSAAGYPAVPERHRLRISGMSCVSCVGRVEAELAKLPCVVSVSVNLADGVASVTALGRDTTPLIAAVKAAGYTAEPLEAGAPVDDRTGEEIRQLRQRFLIAAC